MNTEKRERIIKACCKSNGVAYVSLGQRASVPAGTYREQWREAYRSARFRHSYSTNPYDAWAVFEREQTAVRELAIQVSELEGLRYPAHAGHWLNRQMFFRAWYVIERLSK